MSPRYITAPPSGGFEERNGRRNHRTSETKGRSLLLSVGPRRTVAQPSAPVVPSSSARFLSAVADIKTKKGRKEGGGGGHLKRRSRPRQRTTFAVADNWTVGERREGREEREREEKKIKIVETTGSGGVDDTLPLSLSSVGFPRPPLNAPFSPLPSTSLSSLSFSFVRARAPVSRLLSESSKVKQSETLSGVERTFNNVTKARIRGCLLCHAIATGDGT